MRRFLVVANKTLGSDHLQSEVIKRVAEGPCQFYLVIPATPHSSSRFVWTQGESRVFAQRRLDGTLVQLRHLGADIDGEIGDQWPLTAIADVLHCQRFDEIIVSTLPPGISRWLSQDLPRRVQRTFGIPVIHTVAAPHLPGIIEYAAAPKPAPRGFAVRPARDR